MSRIANRDLKPFQNPRQHPPPRSLFPDSIDDTPHKHGAAVMYFCPDCNAELSERRQKLAMCPNGHGRLVAASSAKARRESWSSTLPLASSLGRGRFAIAGHSGTFRYVDGRQRIRTGSQLAGAVVARYVINNRTLIRAFRQE